MVKYESIVVFSVLNKTEEDVQALVEKNYGKEGAEIIVAHGVDVYLLLLAAHLQTKQTVTMFCSTLRVSPHSLQSLSVSPALPRAFFVQS